MRKRRLWLLSLAALVFLAGPAVAELCTIDAVPAATLLLPYFEVDLADPDGVDTLFSINNASNEPTVAHITLWGDWSRPTIAFNVFLTGYDVETFSLRDMFVGGNLPITSHATNDPMDLISPHGNNAQWDSDPDEPTNPLFPGCDANLPIGTNPVLVPTPPFFADFIGRIRRGHTGQPMDGVGTDECVGADYGDNIARGYITIDNSVDCSLLFPNESGYFAAPGFDSKVNQLWGDWFIINGGSGMAQGDSLVHIEADPSSGFAAGDYTFYGRYVDGLATDQREPLATTWAARYFNGGGFDGGTDLLVWRDSKCDTTAMSYLCSDQPGNNGPPWFPLDETQVVAFDLAEQAAELCTDVPGVPAPGGIAPPVPGIAPIPVQCFELETQRKAVGGDPDFDPPFDFGWLYLNLNFTLGDTSGEVDPCHTDGLFNDLAQSWVTTNMTGFASQLTVGFAGLQLVSACQQSSTCSIDGGSCFDDLDCDGGATSNAGGDLCTSPNQIITGDLG